MILAYVITRAPALFTLVFGFDRNTNLIAVLTNSSALKRVFFQCFYQG